MELYDHLRRNASAPDLNLVPEEARRTFALAMGEYVLAGVDGFWMEPESAVGHCDAEVLALVLAERACELGNLYIGEKSTGSPIEDMLAGALLWVHTGAAGFPCVDFWDGPSGQVEAFGSLPGDGLAYWLTPQAQVGKYRVDFLLWIQRGDKFGGVVVECDGHAFHERTKEQAARDKSRDRDLLSAGYPVMRFTGSEIYRDPRACAEQVRVPLLAVLDRLRSSQ